MSLRLALLLSCTAAALLGACASNPQREHPLKYPAARRDASVVDNYHGSLVADPYRWLEEPDAPETRAWIEAQNALTESYLSAIPAREALRQRLTELWNYERFGLPVQAGGRYFYTRNDGLQPQAVLYSAERLEAEPRVLLDPNLLSSDGTVSLAQWVPSDDGRYLAWANSDGGTDWRIWHVREVATGRDLPDELRWSKFSDASWTPDSAGFFYTRYPAPEQGDVLSAVNSFPELYYHRVGSASSADRLVYAIKDDPNLGFSASLTEDGALLVLTLWRGDTNNNEVHLLDAAAALAGQAEPRPLFTGFDAQYAFVGADAKELWFQTDSEAPRYRIVGAPRVPTAPLGPREVVPQCSETIQGASAVGGRLLVSYLADARSLVRLHALDGQELGELQLPGIGTVAGLGGKLSDAETFYAFTSYTQPTSIWRLDPAQGTSSLFRTPKLAFDPGDYVTEQHFYTSKDGTRVPLLLSYKRGLAKDGALPVHLYGYGGFNIALTPAYSPANLAWMELGGVHAVANLRGGGEYGSQWHEAGTKLLKQNVFDDFIAAAEWLVQEGWTRPERIAISGGSNGGLLVGACMVQRPELFGAALPAVGVLDMLRFAKFTIGWAWVPDYGSVEVEAEFRALRAYSPLHNLVPGTHYPATLVVTGDHDDRVVPGHSFKFAAALQAAQGGQAPTLIRIETRAGHGAGKSTSQVIGEAADRWAFLVKVLDLDLAQVPAYAQRLSVN